MDNDDEVLKAICFLLKQHNVFHWLCHGTLLGIIREGRLLPWDHDIDIAVWDNDVTKRQIVNILEGAGYVQEIVFGETDCLHFYGENKKIDISFYKVKKSIASVKWVVPSEGMILKGCVDCMRIIATDCDIQEIDLAEGHVKRLIHLVLLQLSRILKKFMPYTIKTYFHRILAKRLDYRGYSYPIDLMVFQEIEYKGFMVFIPNDFKKCLEMTYGKDWMVPKKDYVWYEEADNIIDL